MMHFLLQSKQSGFSLVEVLVAISILLLVIVGPMTVISQSNRSSAFAAEQVQATFLAQEGVELIQKIRDDLALEYFNGEFYGVAGATTQPMADFIAAINDCIGAGDTCGVHINDSGSVGVTSCSPLSNCLLRQNTNLNGRARFIHGGGGEATPYTRSIAVAPTYDGSLLKEVEVTSTVTWRTGSLIASQEVVVESFLLNVYDAN